MLNRLDGAYDKFLAVFAKRSGRIVALAALVFYAGLGLALPLALDWRVDWFIFANAMGTMLAGSVILAWITLQLQARDRRHLVEWTSDLRLLDAQEFEWLVGELFRREGWQVEETGRHDGPDGNVDLRLTRGSTRTIVQCKRWTSWWIDVDAIRAFAGTLLREGLPGSAGVFVTLSGFTTAAEEEATRIGLTLIDNRTLFTRIEAARRTEPCPICAARMVLDRSSRGWWFRCIAVGCTGKRDLGPEPARAVELLTQLP